MISKKPYQVFFAFVLLLFLQGFSLEGKATTYDKKVKSKLDLGIGAGGSCYLGTLNLYPDDLFGLYRTDGNRFGLSGQTNITYNLNRIFSFGIMGSYNQLQGTVTYAGLPEQLMEYIAGMSTGAQGDYKTSVISILPTFGINLTELYNRIFSFRSFSISSLWLTLGYGISKTSIEKTAFKSYDFYYDITQSESKEHTGSIGLKYRKKLRPKISLFCQVNLNIVNTMKLDGYYIAGEQKYESLPSENKLEEPSVLEGYMNVHVGFTFHFFTNT